MHFRPIKIDYVGGLILTPVHVVTVVTVVRSEVWRILRNMKEKGMRIESITGELSIWRNSVRKYLKTDQLYYYLLYFSWNIVHLL